MPTVGNTQDKYVEAFNALVPNPGKRFITADQELLFLNQAAITVAAKLGGLSYIFDVTPVVDQIDYPLPDQIYKVLNPAWLISNPGDPAESAEAISVLPYNTFQSFKKSEVLVNRTAWFSEDLNNLRIEPTLTDVSQVLRLAVWGLPQEITGAITLFDGDVTQMNAIALEAASLARFRSRDNQESAILHQRMLDAVEDAAVMKSIKNRINRVRIGQDTPTNDLRRI